MKKTLLRKPKKFKSINANEITYRIENNIKFNLENKIPLIGYRRKKGYLVRKKHISASILFDAVMKFYIKCIHSPNDVIKLKYFRTALSKQIIIESLNIYVLKTIKNIPLECFIHKPSFVRRAEFNKETIVDQAIATISNLLEDDSYEDTVAMMVLDIRNALEVKEYKNKHLNTLRVRSVKEHLQRRRHYKINLQSFSRGYQDTYAYSPNENYVMYPLLYATSRKPVKDESNNIIDYGNERNAHIGYGECLVKIEKSNKLGGEINKSFLLKLCDVIFNGNSQNRSISLKSVEHLELASFRERLRFLYTTANDNEMMLYIHGYKNSFKDAAERAAQISYDLKFPGVTSFFSWASANEVLKGYTADEATTEISAKHLYKYIFNLWKYSSTKKIHIIAHSMGNRVLMNTLKKIKDENDDIKFGHIIMVAPDIDTELFKDNSYLYSQFSEMSTLYVSPDDDAIRKSYNIHKENRVGLSPPVVVEKGIDTINVNQLMSRALWDFGHSYYTEAEALLYDLHELILHYAKPEKRPKLQKVEVGGKRYWQLCIE